MWEQVLSVAEVVCTVVGAVTLYTLLVAGLLAWAMPRLRRGRRERGRTERMDVTATDRRAGSWAEIPSWVNRDREWAAAVVLLGAPRIAEKTSPYVDFPSRRIDWLGLRSQARGWSRRDRVLVEVAYDLAESQHRPDDEAVPAEPVMIADLAIGLQEADLHLVQAAMDLRRGTRALGDVLERGSRFRTTS